MIAIKEKKPKDFDFLLEESHKPKPEAEGEGEEPAQDEESSKELKLIENEDRDITDKLIRSYDYKAFKSNKNSILKLSDLRIFHYEHIIEEPKEDAGENDPAPRNSVEELKERYTQEVVATEQKLTQFWNKIFANKVQESRPVTARSVHTEKSAVQTEQDAAEGEEGEKPKPPPELIQAGFQEKVMEQATLQEEKLFGSTEEPPRQTHWNNFDNYAKNTSKIEYNKTSVAHLLISAIKHASQKDQSKSSDLESRNEEISELENLLKSGYREIETGHIYEEEQPDLEKSSYRHSTNKENIEEEVNLNV